LNSTILSRGSIKTAATGKLDATVAELDKTKEMIDYKNETFNDIAYEIFAAREKIKAKIVEGSPDSRKSKSKGKRRV